MNKKTTSPVKQKTDRDQKNDDKQAFERIRTDDHHS